MKIYKLGIFVFIILIIQTINVNAQNIQQSSSTITKSCRINFINRTDGNSCEFDTFDTKIGLESMLNLDISFNFNVTPTTIDKNQFDNNGPIKLDLVTDLDFNNFYTSQNITHPQFFIKSDPNIVYKPGDYNVPLNKVNEKLNYKFALKRNFYQDMVSKLGLKFNNKINNLPYYTTFDLTNSYVVINYSYQYTIPKLKIEFVKKWENYGYSKPYYYDDSDSYSFKITNNGTDPINNGFYLSTELENNGKKTNGSFVNNNIRFNECETVTYLNYYASFYNCKITLNLKQGDSKIFTFKTNVFDNTPEIKYKINLVAEQDSFTILNELEGKAKENIINNYEPVGCKFEDINNFELFPISKMQNCFVPDDIYGFKSEQSGSSKTNKYKVKSITNPKYFEFTDNNKIIKVNDFVTKDFKAQATKNCIGSSVISLEVTTPQNLVLKKLNNIELTCSTNLVIPDLKVNLIKDELLKINSTNNLKIKINNVSERNWLGRFKIEHELINQKITYIKPSKGVNCEGVGTNEISCSSDDTLIMKKNIPLYIEVQVWTEQNQQDESSSKLCLDSLQIIENKSNNCFEYNFKVEKKNETNDLLKQMISLLQEFFKILKTFSLKF